MSPPAPRVRRRVGPGRLALGIVPAVLGAGLIAGAGAGAGAAPQAPEATTPAPASHLAHGNAPGGPGARWPGARVTYSDASGYPRIVREAVRQWNAATTSLRLVPVPKGRRGQIHITRNSRCGTPCAYYPPDGRIFLPFRGPDDLSRRDTVAVTVHEFGHALGLPHVGTCAVMTPFVGFRECPPPKPFSYRCGPQPGDARAIVRLYGGRVRTDGLCRLERPKPARTTLVAPAGVVSAPAADAPLTLTVRLRNASAVPWIRGGSHSPLLLFSNGVGGTIRYCDQFALAPRERVVRRGGIATFRVRVCPPGFGPVTIAVPAILVLETEGGQSRSRPLPLRVAYPAAPEPEPLPEPIPEPLPDPPPDPPAEEPAPIA